MLGDNGGAKPAFWLAAIAPVRPCTCAERMVLPAIGPMCAAKMFWKSTKSRTTLNPTGFTRLIRPCSELKAE